MEWPKTSNTIDSCDAINNCIMPIEKDVPSHIQLHALRLRYQMMKWKTLKMCLPHTQYNLYKSVLMKTGLKALQEDPPQVGLINVPILHDGGIQADI